MTEAGKYEQLKKTRAYTAEEIETDGRPCLVHRFAG